jgi:heme/copper-type cytochrome/quinol oxidase subunit 2
LGTTTAVKSALLWTVVLAAPTAWAATLLANYVLTARACGPRLGFTLSLIAAAMLGVVGATAIVAWRVRQRAGHQTDDARDDATGTDHFMAHLALLDCVLFAIAIAAQALTPWILRDCA